MSKVTSVIIVGGMVAMSYDIYKMISKGFSIIMFASILIWLIIVGINVLNDHASRRSRELQHMEAALAQLTIMQQMHAILEAEDQDTWLTTPSAGPVQGFRF